MKLILNKSRGSAHRGITLVEMLMAVGLGSLLLAAIGTLFVTSLTSFAGLGNYADLTHQSRLSLDRMSSEIRESSRVIACNTNLPTKSLTLTNAFTATTTTYTWDSTTGVITMQRPGGDPQVFLTGCDAWDFNFYQRTPNSSWTFFPTKDYRLAKLINMSWKCSRRIVGTRINTETVVTSQVVLRNKL